MDLKEIRKYINVIDGQIINLLSQRITLCESLVKIKKKENLPIEQPDRETKMRNQYTVQAQISNLDPDFVWRVFRIIIDEMINQQKTLMKDSA